MNITNQGPDQATGVVLTDSMPAGVTFASVTPGQGSCVPGNPVTCSLGNLANGQTVQVILKVVVNSSQGPLVDMANASSSVTDPAPGNNSVTMSSQVQAAGPRADLSATATSNETSVTVGQSARCTFSVINHGTDTASSVVLNEAATGRATIDSVSSSQGTCIVRRHGRLQLRLSGIGCPRPPRPWSSPLSAPAP